MLMAEPQTFNDRVHSQLQSAETFILHSITRNSCQNNIPLIQLQDSEYSNSWNFDTDVGDKAYLFLNEVTRKRKIVSYMEKEVELTS